jgi:hypothetical protein
MAIAMQTSRKTRLHLDRETIKSLDPRQLSRAAGGAPEPTVMGTHCHSCRGPICVSNTDCSVLC